MIHTKLGNYESAIENFNDVIRLDSLDAYATNNRGYAYLKLGKLKDAYQDFKRSNELDERNSWLHRNWACYYAVKGETDKSLEHLKEAILFGYDDLSWLENEESLASIRADQSYSQIVKQIENPK